MNQRYNPKEIEEKWQKIWEDQKLFKVTEDPKKEKYYLLEMFPYPVGKDPYGPCTELLHWGCGGPV